MATSSSDESSTAPRDFHISSSLDSGSRLSLSRQKCSLCHNFRKNFYCKECVHGGLFYNSKSQATESFTDKKKSLLEIEDNKKAVEKKCLKHLETRQRADVLRTKIRQIKDRNRILKLAVDEKKQKRHKNAANLADLKEKIEKYSRNLPKYEQKVLEMESYAGLKRDKVNNYQEQLNEKRKEIKRIVKVRIEQLKYVFPITKVLPKLEVNASEEIDDTITTALAEASQTTYIRDRWEYTDPSGELQFSVVEPTLPGSGNYSLYNIWVLQNRDAVPTFHSDLIEHNPAFNISAALTYTAQLIQVLAFYFNVRLPYRMVYSDFCGSYMSEPQFNRRVARLNANVLYLCFSQNIDLNCLRACETIHNILQLIDTRNPELGRQGPIEFDGQKAAVLEQSLSQDLQISEDTDSDDGDSFHVEWEAVPHIQCPEVPAGAVNVQSNSQMITTQQATSMAGGLVNSIASMWRGFTGR